MHIDYVIRTCDESAMHMMAGDRDHGFIFSFLTSSPDFAYSELWQRLYLSLAPTTALRHVHAALFGGQQLISYPARSWPVIRLCGLRELITSSGNDTPGPDLTLCFNSFGNIKSG